MSVSDKWKKLSEETIWSSPWWEHRRAVFEQPDAEPVTYDYPWARDGVMVVVVNDKGQILLQSQYRPFIEAINDQFPAGGVEDGETPAEAAKRELAEESRLQAKNWQEIGFFYPSPGAYGRKGFVFIASDLSESEELKRDEYELSHRWLSTEEVDEMIMNGKLLDGWVVTSWCLARKQVLELIDAQN